MKKTTWISIVCMLLQSMQTVVGIDSCYLILRDGARVESLRSILRESRTLSNILEDDTGGPEDLEIPIDLCTKQLWDDVIYQALQKLAKAREKKVSPDDIKTWLAGKVRPENNSPDLPLCRDTIIVSNYLDIPELLAAATHIYGQYLKNNCTNMLDNWNLFAEYLDPLPNEIQNILSSHVEHPLLIQTMKTDHAVLSIAFDPSGKILVSGLRDETIKLWNLEDPQSVRLLSTLDRTSGGHKNSVWTVAFNRSGKMFASGSCDDTIKLWNITDLKTVQLLSTLDKTAGGHSSSVYSVAFNRSGAILASGSDDKAIKLWDTKNPEAVQLLSTLGKTAGGHSSSVYSVAFNPAGDILASGSRDGEIKLWSTSDPQSVQLLTTLCKASVDHKDTVYSVAFNPDGTILASGSCYKISLWNTKNPESVRLLTTLCKASVGYKDTVFSVAFNPSRATLASGSTDKTIKLWNATDPRSVQLLTTISEVSGGGHSSSVDSITFNRSGTILASGSGDGVNLWYNGESLKQRLLLCALEQRFVKTGKKTIIKETDLADITEPVRKRIRLLANVA
jgi:WD40 repeat protein